MWLGHTRFRENEGIAQALDQVFRQREPVLGLLLLVPANLLDFSAEAAGMLAVEGLPDAGHQTVLLAVGHQHSAPGDKLQKPERPARQLQAGDGHSHELEQFFQVTVLLGRRKDPESMDGEPKHASGKWFPWEEKFGVWAGRVAMLQANA